MDPWDALENMAATATSGDDVAATPADITRWETLFGFSASVARDNIEQYRGDLYRETISDEQWEEVSEQRVKEGFDREAYEYYVFCDSKRPRKTVAPPKTLKEDLNTYAVKLLGHLDSPEKIQQIAGLPTKPEIQQIESLRDADHKEGDGEDDTEGDDTEGGENAEESDGQTAQICFIDAKAKARISEWFVRQGLDTKPHFMTFSIARKELCSYSAYPTLGVDTTLPQYRAQDTNDVHGPQPPQNQYPVWYFFYGTLAEPERLMSLLHLDKTPEFKNASITGGAVRTWKGKYRALVDGEDTVTGSAFLVENQAQETALRGYETKEYEVVRCGIQMDEGWVAGLTFRFIDKMELD